MKQKVALITGITGQDGELSCRVFTQKGLYCPWDKRRTSLLIQIG